MKKRNIILVAVVAISFLFIVFSSMKHEKENTEEN